MEPEATIGLQEAADRLGVHYMTAYRYVRTGRLEATRIGGEWRVAPAAIAALRVKPPVKPAVKSPPTSRAASRATARAAATRRLAERLCANDEAGAWRIVEDALASGADPIDVLVDLLAPAMAGVGDRWAAGELSVADEHRATAIAHRVVGRLGPRFARRGRKRGTIVIGAPAGDHHALPVAIAADVVRGEGIGVVELGADTPAASFADAAVAVDDLIAVVVTATAGSRPSALTATVRALREAGVAAPIVVGGSSFSDAAARRAGADLPVPGDARQLVEVIDELARVRRSEKT